MTRYAVTFGKGDRIMIPAATPSLELALEVAYLIASNFSDGAKPDSAGSEVHLWRYADDDMADVTAHFGRQLLASFTQVGSGGGVVRAR
jgi:hypothetical protein